MFFDSWSDIWRIIVIGILSYSAIVAILRVSGKRSLAKMNAFDFVVTIALGSTLSSILISREVALADGMTALVMLVLLQFVVTWSAVRFKIVRRTVKSEPRMLYYNSRFSEEALKDERITRDEILQAIRNQGIASMKDVLAVILETNGKMSIIKDSGKGFDTGENIRTQ